MAWLCTGVTASCPVWFYSNPYSDSPPCLCYEGIEGYISCSQNKSLSLLHLGKAIGYKTHKEQVVVAHIPYIYPDSKIFRTNVTNLQINLTRSIHDERDELCASLHRNSSLKYIYCGHCNKHYGPAIYSYGLQCAKCHMYKGFALYFSLQILPISIFYAVVLIFRVDLTRPVMFHYIVFCNSVTFIFRYSAGLVMNYLYANGNILKNMMKVGLTLSGVWSLDFLRFVVPPFCFSSKIHDCVIPFFDFFPVVYLLLVTAIISIFIKLHGLKLRVILLIWMPFHRLLEKFGLNRDPVEAVTHTYATFFFLYLYKTMSVAFVTALTSPAFTDRLKLTERLTIYYDPTVTYFDGRHVTIIMISFTIAAVLVLPALLLLTFFRSSGVQRFYQTQLNRQCQVIVRIFVRTLENGYKDGSNGTKDLRPVAGVYFLLMIVGGGIIMAMLRVLVYSDNIPWPLATAGYAMLAVLYGTLQPYKKKSQNNMPVFIYSVLIVISNFTCFIEQRQDTQFYHIQHNGILALIMLLILTVNLIYTVYITHKILQYFKVWGRVRRGVVMVCHVCRCPCRGLVRNEEGERLLSQQGLPNYYQ